MKKTRVLESKTLTVLLLLVILGNVIGIVSTRRYQLTPTDYRHCGVFEFSGANGSGHVEFTNAESSYNITRQGEFCANMEFFAKSETGLVPISALNRLHNGDSLIVIPVYDSVYAELLKVKPDTSPLMLQVEGLSEGLTERDPRLEAQKAEILRILTPHFTGQPDWITYALRTDEQGEVNLIIIFEDLDTEQIYAVEVTGAYFDEQDVFHFGEKELRLADVREFERQAAADPTWIWGNGKGLASE